MVVLNSFSDDNNNIYNKVTFTIYLIKLLIQNYINERSSTIEDKIYYFCHDIYNEISIARINGINNENYLFQGNDIITDLQFQIRELQLNLNIYDNKYLNVPHNKYHHQMGCICNVHNKILSNIKLVNMNDIKMSINLIDNINSDIEVAIKMNNNMGNAIKIKNEFINELLQYIERLQNNE